MLRLNGFPVSNRNTWEKRWRRSREITQAMSFSTGIVVLVLFTIFELIQVQPPIRLLTTTHELVFLPQVFRISEGVTNIEEVVGFMSSSVAIGTIQEEVTLEQFKEGEEVGQLYTITVAHSREISTVHYWDFNQPLRVVHTSIQIPANKWTSPSIFSLYYYYVGRSVEMVDGRLVIHREIDTSMAPMLIIISGLIIAILSSLVIYAALWIFFKVLGRRLYPRRGF